MELILEHEELQAVLVQYWKNAGVRLPETAKLIIRCNHKTNTARAVIVAKEKQDA